MKIAATATLKVSSANYRQRPKQTFDAISFTSSPIQRSTTLFRENDDPRGVYVLCDGQAKVSMNSSEGKTLILRIARAGAILGLTDVLSGNAHGITVETLHTSRVSFVRPGKTLCAFSRSIPRLIPMSRTN